MRKLGFLFLVVVLAVFLFIYPQTNTQKTSANAETVSVRIGGVYIQPNVFGLPVVSLLAENPATGDYSLIVPNAEGGKIVNFRPSAKDGFNCSVTFEQNGYIIINIPSSGINSCKIPAPQARA